MMGWEAQGSDLEKGEPGTFAELRTRAYFDGESRAFKKKKKKKKKKKNKKEKKKKQKRK